MKKLLVVLAMIAALGATAPSAQAGMITLNATNYAATFEYNGGTACPDCHALVTLALNLDMDTNFIQSLVLNFKNTSTDGIAGLDLLTAFEFVVDPDLTFGTATFSNMSSNKKWEWGPQGSGFGKIALSASSLKGATNGLDGGESGSVLVSVTSPTNVLDLTVDSTAVHIQALANGGSIKPEGCVAGSVECGGQVPEPTTLLLLGTGLVGAVRAVRRRRAS